MIVTGPRRNRLWAIAGEIGGVRRALRWVMRTLSILLPPIWMLMACAQPAQPTNRDVGAVVDEIVGTTIVRPNVDPPGASAPEGAAPAPAVTTPPATVQDAARQMAEWLQNPSEAGTPPLLTAQAPLVILHACAHCRKATECYSPMRRLRVHGSAALAETRDRLASGSPAGGWTAGPDIQCKKQHVASGHEQRCEFRSSTNKDAVELTKVWIVTDATGKPIRYRLMGVSSCGWQPSCLGAVCFSETTPNAPAGLARPAALWPENQTSAAARGRRSDSAHSQSRSSALAKPAPLR